MKLPSFSGRQEDFSQFKSQFRELCKGEGYTPILEMVQLRLKLPREALSAITGIQCPEQAWTRLEEIYGNREMSILSTMKCLRDFRTTKQAAHEQLIELAMAVQKCQTELANISATHEFLGDREAIACVIQALPPTIRDKWYDCKVPSDTRKKGEFLVAWIETQREKAIRVRLDTMAAKLRGEPQTTAKPKAPADTTDKGLQSQSLHVLDATRAGSEQQDKQPGSGAHGGRLDVNSDEDAKMIAERRKTNLIAKKLDRCPVCDIQHTYERVWSHVQPPIKAKLLSTHLTTCAKFLALPTESKLAAVMGNAACLQCATWDHTIHKFPSGKTGKDPKCSVIIDSKACGGKHGKWYHEGGESGGAHSVVSAANHPGPGLYEVYLAPVHPPSESASIQSAEGMIMIDPGSDTNFIRNDFALQLGLTGEPCHFRLKVVEMEARPISTMRYTMEMEDKDGARHTVIAMGLDTITVLPSDPDLSVLRDLVNGYPPEVLARPQGEVDILLGLRNSALHGSTVEQWDNLRILQSPLGCGWSLRGSHPKLQYSLARLAPLLSATGYMIRQAEVEEDQEVRVYHIQSRREFHELDELGTAPPPVCLKCKGCKECTFRRRRLTPDEQEVVARVENEMKVDTLTGTITAQYPWKKCVRRMVENRRQAMKVQEMMEKHMVEVATHAGYVEEMMKAIAEGKVRKLTKQEMDDWHGPTHYITTFAVVKPDSVSTRTRVVSNSAMRNARSKLSLNQCMWPGPNALCDLYDCLVFWRAVEVAMVTDLQKAYQAIHTGPMELHLRRFLFRAAQDRDWEDYAFTRANVRGHVCGAHIRSGQATSGRTGRAN